MIKEMNLGKGWFIWCLIWLAYGTIIIVGMVFWMSTQSKIQLIGISPDDVKKAMMKMGPDYQYRMLSNGTLQVNKGDGKWLRLKYK